MELTPMIVVQDVEASSAWYQQLFGLKGAHGGDEFEMLMNAEGALQLLLHRSEHGEHAGLETPGPRGSGTGVLFYFSVPDLESYVDRAEEMRVEIVASPNFNKKAHALVLCSQSLFRFLDLGDDGFGQSRPDEWLGVFVSPIDVVGDGLDELSDAGDGEAFELPSREFTEEALNEIQPRGGGRGEVELHSRVFLEPYPNSRMLVRGVVVENDVDVELGRDGPLDLTEESQEFLMPMARHAFVEDLASGHVQSSEEGRGTVTFVVMRHRSSTPFLQGQARLGAVQGLDLALLVESEDHGPLRGVDVEAHHITELLDELGIRGQLEVVDAVRLKAMSLPDTRYRGRMHAYFLGHETATPVRRVSRLVLERLANDLSFVLRSDLLWPTRARSILEQGLDPVRLIAIEPLRNRGPGYTHRSTDRRPRKPLCGGKDDLGPLNHALRRGPFVHQLLQTPALSATQPNPTNWQSHADNLPHGIHYARDLCYTILECTIRDPDGYLITISQWQGGGG